MKNKDQIRDVPFLKQIIKYWDTTRDKPFHPNWLSCYDDYEFMDLPSKFIDDMACSNYYKFWLFKQNIKAKFKSFESWFNINFGWFFTNGFKAIDNDAAQKEEGTI